MSSTPDTRQLLLIAAGYLAGLAAMPRLDGFGTALIALLLPTAAAVNYFVCRRVDVGRRPVEGDGASATAIRAIGFRITVFQIALHTLILANLSGLVGGRSVMPARLVVVLFGLLLIGVGDLLPRTRPNLAVGIRTPWMLANRDAWMRLHRVAGYATVGLGGVIVVAGMFLENPVLPQVVSAALITAAAVVVTSYRRIARVQEIA